METTSLERASTTQSRQSKEQSATWTKATKLTERTNERRAVEEESNALEVSQQKAALYNPVYEAHVEAVVSKVLSLRWLPECTVCMIMHEVLRPESQILHTARKIEFCRDDRNTIALDLSSCRSNCFFPSILNRLSPRVWLLRIALGFIYGPNIEIECSNCWLNFLEKSSKHNVRCCNSTVLDYIYTRLLVVCQICSITIARQYLYFLNLCVQFHSQMTSRDALCL